MRARAFVCYRVRVRVHVIKNCLSEGIFVHLPPPTNDASEAVARGEKAPMTRRDEERKNVCLCGSACVREREGVRTRATRPRAGPASAPPRHPGNTAPGPSCAERPPPEYRWPGGVRYSKHGRVNETHLQRRQAGRRARRRPALRWPPRRRHLRRIHLRTRHPQESLSGERVSIGAGPVSGPSPVQGREPSMR